MTRRALTILLISFLWTTQLLATENNKANPSEGTYPEDGIFTGTKTMNLLKNPGFENKTSNWTLGKHHGGKGLFTTDTLSSIGNGRSAKIILENSTNNYNNVQLFSFIPLTSLAKYAITFKAKVEKACLVSISVSNGFDTYFEEKLLLRPDTQHYGPFIFKSKREDFFSYFSFNLGKAHATIFIDDVSIMADHTEKEFENLISKSGINISKHQSTHDKSIFISLPMLAESIIPILIYDEEDNILLSKRINEGESEITISLADTGEINNYIVKVFTPLREESFQLNFMDKQSMLTQSNSPDQITHLFTTK